VYKPTTLLRVMRAPGEGAAAAVRMKGPQWARTLPCAYGPEVPMRALRLWPGPGQVRLVSESQSDSELSLHKLLTEWPHVFRVH
jgi:hypothetical protein